MILITMNLNKIILATLSLILIVSLAVHTESTRYLNDGDKSRLRKIVELKTPLSANDISSIYYNVNLRSNLDKSIADAAKICEHIKATPLETLESIYFATSMMKAINCQLDANKLSTKIQALVKDDSSVLDLYRAGLSLSNLNKPLDSTKYSKLLVEALKREDSLLNTGLAFQLASRFTKAADQNVFADKIADVVVQADEVNGKYLQFEGGLGVSSAVIRGIYQLATASNKPIGITNEQAIKFVNYFLSRKYVLTAKGASEVIDTLALFTNNKYHIPYLVTKFGSSALSRQNSVFTIKVTNVLGDPVGPVSVTGTSLETVDGQKTPVLKNIVFKPVTGDSTLFAYDFFEKSLPSGFYDLSVDAVPQKPDPRILGNTGVKIRLSILTQIKIDNAELSITDVEVGTKNFKLIYPSSIEQLAELDYLQRIQLKFQIKDLNNENLVNVHQAFVRFYHLATKQEIIFISELDSNDFYKVDLNLQARSKDFNDLSGSYQIDLIIGDPLIEKAIDWTIGTIQIQFASTTGQQTTVLESALSEYEPKPEIKHVFREQDKRPPAVVSNFFTFLVLVPLIGLIFAWIKIGVNLSNCPCSLSAILFHGSLASIFLLYTCFFIELNMFQTIKYLAGLSIVAYLSGHSLLSSLIEKKKKL